MRSVKDENELASLPQSLLCPSTKYRQFVTLPALCGMGKGGENWEKKRAKGKKEQKAGRRWEWE